MKKASIIVVMLVVSSGLCLAQSERGIITGIVTDVSGGRLPGASVTITHVAMATASQPYVTGDTGEYTVPNLVPGQYKVEVSAPGFRRLITDVTLTAGATVRVDARLQLGEISETIEVQAEAAQLQTENSKVSAAVDNQLIDQLPLVVGGAMRSAFDLVSVVAEAKGTGSNMVLGGGQAGAWGATLDGTPVQTNRSGDTTETAYLTPSVEALTEFAVDTNGFKAEYGQAGGGAITFASKSGTNEFHGSVYDFLRNDAFDARGFFAPRRGVYKQNNFGAAVGGPVYIPGLYNGKGNTFFYFTYEGFRNRSSENGAILSVPTPEMFDGDFSNLVNNKGQKLIIYDPATTRPNPNGSGYIRDPFKDNKIPLDRFSNVAKQIMKYAKSVAVANRGAAPGTYSYINSNYIVTSGSSVAPQDKFSLKVDHNIGSSHHLAFFFNKTTQTTKPGPSGPPGLALPLYTGQQSDYTASVYRLTEDWVITPKAVAHFIFSANEFEKNSFSPNAGQGWKDKVCIPNVVDCNTNFPQVSFSEFSTWGAPSYNGAIQPSRSIRGDLTWIRGSHNFKFGANYDRLDATGFGQQSIAGSPSFSFRETSVPGVTSQTSGSSFASFLLGAADSGGTETVRLLSQLFEYYAMYAQDDWRINDKLTLNLGVRYEFTLPPVANKDQYSEFSPTKPNPAVNNFPGALIFAGNGEGREGKRRLIPGWYGAVSPRFGLAYRAADKTVVRAAVAKTYSRVAATWGTLHYAGFIGNYSFTSPDSGITPAFYMDKGLPSYPLPPLIDPAFANNQNVDYWFGSEAVRAPEAYNWTLSIQHQFAPKLIVEANYNAAIGVHLQSGLMTLNQVPMSKVNEFIAKYGAAATVTLLNSGITSAQAKAAGIEIPYPNFTNSSVQKSQSVGQALRPYPQYLNINTGSSAGDKSGHSSYHAMILKVNKQMSGGLSLQWSYSLSKLLTDSDTYQARGASQDHANRSAEKSIGQFDQTHTVKLNTVFELPFGKGRRWLANGIASQVLGGWRISVIQSYSTGFPIGLTRNAPLNIFNGSNRPTITTDEGWIPEFQGGKFDPNRDKYLDPAVFPTQPVGQLGNATRYNPKARSMPSLTENVSVGKTFNVNESVRMDFRAEAFNLPNRVQFAAPTTNISSQSFGIVTSQQNNPRQMQFALKLYW